MKLKKYRMYQAPRVGLNSLETEGIFCQSLRPNGQADEIHVIPEGDQTGPVPEEPQHFEF